MHDLPWILMIKEVIGPWVFFDFIPSNSHDQSCDNVWKINKITHSGSNFFLLKESINLNENVVMKAIDVNSVNIYNLQGQHLDQMGMCKYLIIKLFKTLLHIS